MKKSLAILFSGLMVVALAGCGGQNAKPQGAVSQKVMTAPSKQDFQPVTEVKEGRKNVYAIVKAMRGNYWQDIIKGMKDGGNAANVNVYVGGVFKDGNWEMQRDMAKELANKKVDAVILGVSDSNNMTATAKALREKKLPVVLVDTALNSKDYDAAYMTNNIDAGAKAAAKLLELMKANGVKETDQATIALHVSNMGSRTIAERLDSAISYWNTNAPKTWKVDYNYLINYGDKEMAAKKAEEAVKNIKNLKGIISCNNSSTGATVDAVIKANRKDIAVVGFDMSKQTEAGIVNKDYKIASVVQNQYKMGFEAVKTGIAAAEGKAPAAKDVDTGIKIIDNANYKR